MPFVEPVIPLSLLFIHRPAWIPERPKIEPQRRRLRPQTQNAAIEPEDAKAMTKEMKTKSTSNPRSGRENAIWTKNWILIKLYMLQPQNPQKIEAVEATLMMNSPQFSGEGSEKEGTCLEVHW